jgi:histidine ammonia-lyase
VIELGSGTLSCEQICAIARNREQVRLAPGVHARLSDGHRVVVALAGQQPIYGRSTGVGALLDRLRPDAGPNLGTDLLHSHSTTAGPPLPTEEVRAMVAVRLEQITAGRSGLGPVTAEALVDSLNKDRMPQVGRFHSLGTGDVAPLARLALTLPAHALDVGDALALMSSNALAIGRSALCVVDLEQLLHAATVTAAISFLARDGAAEALRAEAAGPFPGPQRVARTLRALGAGTRPAARLQDQYGLRTAPQTLGIAVDTADALRAVVTGMAGAGLENPMVLVGNPPSAVHHGAFHAVHLTSALDAATLGLLRAGVGSTNRLSLLTTPMTSPSVQPGSGDGPGQRPFLAGGPPTASGIMVLEYTGAAALGVLRASAVPAALQTADLSHGVEQDATFAPLAVDQLTDAIAAATVVVAVELVAAVRALRLRGFAVPAELADIWRICLTLPAGTQDRDLSEDLELAQRLLVDIAPYGERAAGGPVRPMVMSVPLPDPPGDAAVRGDRPEGG